MHLALKETSVSLFEKDDRKFLCSQMLVLSHSLEKGLSMMIVKKGFGTKKAANLCLLIERYKQKYGNDDISYPFIESCGILQAYMEYQIAQKFDLGVLRTRIEALLNSLSDIQRKALSNFHYGVVVLNKSFLNGGQNGNYERIVSTRRSVRSYSEEIVEVDKIKKAIELANYSPSACNRQPCNVYVALGGANAKKVNELLSGNTSFTNDVSNFAVVTCDRSYFIGKEQYQWYINGGIYLSNFVLSLHSMGIGNCIMQWFAFSSKEKQLKKLLGIGKSEAIIAIVSFGYYLAESKCLCAQRKPVEETLHFIK